MTATRTIAIGLPDDPNASVYDILSALQLTIGNLGAAGDFQSASIISNLSRHIQMPRTPFVGNEIWNLEVSTLLPCQITVRADHPHGWK